MTTTGPFVLDSDVFIAAKNAYDAFTICPGFWASLIGHHEAGNVISIDRVSDELLMGRETEDLVRWVRTHVPETFFRSTAELPVAEAYTEIMTWVQRSTRYADAAKSKFATGADGWLVAYARVHELTLATNEQPRPEARNPDQAAGRLHGIRGRVLRHVRDAARARHELLAGRDDRHFITGGVEHSRLGQQSPPGASPDVSISHPKSDLFGLFEHFPSTPKRDRLDLGV